MLYEVITPAHTDKRELLIARDVVDGRDPGHGRDERDGSSEDVVEPGDAGLRYADH